MSNVLVKIWEGGVHLLWEVREKTARSFCMSVVGLWCVLVWILNQCWSTDELAVGGKDFVGEGSDICHDMRGEGRQYKSCEDEPCWGEDDLKFVHWFIIGYYIGQRNPRCLCENCCWFYSEVGWKEKVRYQTLCWISSMRWSISLTIFSQLMKIYFSTSSSSQAILSMASMLFQLFLIFSSSCSILGVISLTMLYVFVSIFFCIC